MRTVAVIMAGGRGERFWPMSRGSCPKQFLSLTSDGKTMIQKTFERVCAFINPEDVFIVTNKDYINIVTGQLPHMPASNILCEPLVRNTAPCIALAATVITKKYGDAVMTVLASDHLIKNDDLFADVISTGIKAAAEGDKLITIGITPSYPETGYGYIKFKHGSGASGGIYRVEKFTEKPAYENAKEYVGLGTYLWNSGIFIWKASVILNNIKKHIPEYTAGLKEIYDSYNTPEFENVLNSVFPRFESISIDFGVMEKADNVYTIPGAFGWDDVGSWAALDKINMKDDCGNVISGDVITVDAPDNIIIGKDKLIAAVGVRDIVIVQTDDALLICNKDSAQDVKKVVETLKKSDRNSLL